MIKRITNNFWWKVLSIFLAFLTWLMVVNYEDPQISRTFIDVPVEKLNIDAIESEKKAIEYREGETVTVRVRGKRSVVDSMSMNDIYAYADLEKKSITDAVDIVIEVPDSVSILEKEPNMMMVELENIVTVQKAVQPYMEGEPEEGYVYLEPSVIPNNIEVEGPESKVGLIKSVLVPVTIDGVTRDVTLFGKPQFFDESNNLISGLTPSTNQVQIKVPIQKTKIVNLRLETGDSVGDGYELINVSLSQNTLSVKGPEASVRSLDTITVSGLNLRPLTEDTILEIDVDTILPTGVTIHDDVETLNAYVDIEPIERLEIPVTHETINVKYIPDGLQFGYIGEETYSIVYSGIPARLEGLDIERVGPFISLRGLEEGIHTVPLQYYEPVGVDILSDRPNITIELIAEPVEETEDGETPVDGEETTEEETNNG